MDATENPATPPQPAPAPANSFKEAGAKEDVGFLQEVIGLLKHNKKYWMIPILVILLLFGVLLILGATSAAPFIYTLF